jgi:phage terminase large subunit-like protein
MSLHSSYLTSLPAPQRSKILEAMDDDLAQQLLYDWSFWARPEQLPPPGDWKVWNLRSGRGFGKTRTGAEWVRARVESGRFGRIALVGKTKSDVRDTMVEVAQASILKISPPWNMPAYEPSKRRLTWPNGAIAIAYSGDDPDQLRGPEHDSAWVDELAKFQYPRETWDNLQLGLRIGPKPQICNTTTPRPLPIVKEIIAHPKTHDVRGATYDNIPNLAPEFIEYILDTYEGTHLGRQELHGLILDDMPGALWTRALIESLRVLQKPDVIRAVVGVDPQASKTAEGAGTGIVVAGTAGDARAPHAYVLADNTLSGSPGEWAAQAIAAYHTWDADYIVAETNQGGDMVVETIANVDPNVPVKKVRASVGKEARAQPIAAFYEQKRVHHLGTLGELEDELCSWVPGQGESPHRLDAMVYALTDLLKRKKPYGKPGVSRYA